MLYSGGDRMGAVSRGSIFSSATVGAKLGVNVCAQQKQWVLQYLLTHLT